jgi:hypothetical protein
MTDTRRKRSDSIKSLDDLKSRCTVDEAGCWLWRYAMHQRPHGSPVPTCYAVPPLVEKPGPMPAARAAWILAGKRLKRGEIVWRSKCSNHRCVNPQHCSAGKRAEMHQMLADSGRLKGNPHRAVVNARNRLGMVKPVEIVRRAEAMFAAGALQKDVRAALGLSAATAKVIREGRHPHSASKPHTAKHASVFAWASAAAYREAA